MGKNWSIIVKTIDQIIDYWCITYWVPLYMVLTSTKKCNKKIDVYITSEDGDFIIEMSF